MVWYGLIWFDMVWHVWFNMVWYGLICSPWYVALVSAHFDFFRSFQKAIPKTHTSAATHWSRFFSENKGESSSLPVTWQEATSDECPPCTNIMNYMHHRKLSNLISPFKGDYFKLGSIRLPSIMVHFQGSDKPTVTSGSHSGGWKTHHIFFQPEEVKLVKVMKGQSVCDDSNLLRITFKTKR